MGDCLQTGKPSRDTKVNSAFQPFGIGKSSTGLFGVELETERIYLCRVAGNKHCAILYGK